MINGVLAQGVAFDTEVSFAVQSCLRVANTMTVRSGAASPTPEWMEFIAKIIRALSTYRELTYDVTTEAGLRAEFEKTFSESSQRIRYTFMMMPKLERQTFDCQIRMGASLNNYFQAEFSKIGASMTQASTNFNQESRVEQSLIHAQYANLEKDANSCLNIVDTPQRRTCYLEVVS
jgi:hypothetical protein